MPLAHRAAVGFLAAASAFGVPFVAAARSQPDRASKAETEQAQSHYEAGVEFFRRRRFDSAAEAFKQSYEVVASPNSHMMYARALSAAGRTLEAYEEMAVAAREARTLAERIPKYAKTVLITERERARLLRQVAAVAIELKGTAAGARIFVGARSVPRSRWGAIAVEPGKVDVVARLPGGRRVWRLVDARIGETVTVDLDLSAPPAPRQPASPERRRPHETAASSRGPRDSVPHFEPVHLRPFAYAAAAAGAAGLVTFGVMGALSRKTFSDLEATCPGNRCPNGARSDIDRGRNQQTIANVGLVVGILGLGGGAALYVLDERRAPARGTARITVVAGAGTVSLSGGF